MLAFGGVLRRYQYEKIPDDMARSWYHLPNWWKAELNLGVKLKGRADGYAVPRALESELDRRIAAVTMGVSQVLSGRGAQCSVLVLVFMVRTSPRRLSDTVGACWVLLERGSPQNTRSAPAEAR